MSEVSIVRVVADPTCDDLRSVVAPEACPAPLRIPLHHILLPANVPAGLSPWILFTIADSLRNAGRDVRDPIVVQRLIGLDLWRIVDGRHRYVASIMAGVRDILATEVP